MYRFEVGDLSAYSFTNEMSYYFILFVSLFFFKYKKDIVGFFSKMAIRFFSAKSKMLEKISLIVFASVESLLTAHIITRSTFFNMTFGELVGTGANYFATLILAPTFIFAFSLIILANPIKQVDMYTLLLPLYLIPVKLACFFNGCCWGIEWEYGLYNHHPSHPGRQVPAQAIEILFAIIIFIILFFYKNKAKTGTIFPMYMILYGGTRFFIEFLKAGYPNVLGPFKVYHILCFICFVVGIILFFVARKFGDKFSDFFEKLYSKLDTAIAMKKALKEQLIAEENIKREADMQERLEKAKLARAKASVKYRK